MEWMPLLFSYLFIFFARVADMSLDVVRILMLMRDRRLLAALIGFVEVTIFILALNQVLSGGLYDIGKIIAYAGGFATGNYIGSIIEQKLALGYLSLQIFPAKELCSQLVDSLRNEGFGVTEVQGQGRTGERTILFVLLKRKDVNRVQSILNSVDCNIFFNFSDARSIRGGVFPAKKGK